jgi:amidase
MYSALIDLNPDVQDIAAGLDTERTASKLCSTLHGIPFIIKDNIASNDSIETTAGSKALLGNIVPRDAYVIAQL